MSDIPMVEAAALRQAFENTMSKTFGWENFRRTEDGYVSPMVQAAWFACRCGWICGHDYRASSPPVQPKGGHFPDAGKMVALRTIGAAGPLGDPDVLGQPKGGDTQSVPAFEKAEPIRQYRMDLDLMGMVEDENGGWVRIEDVAAAGVALPDGVVTKEPKP